MSMNAALAGKGIVITRARHQAPQLEALIREFGGIPVAYPCLEIGLPADTSRLDACLRRLGEFDWLALCSGNAVWAIAERARALGGELDMNPVNIAALGPATAGELRRQFSRPADFMPRSASAESLAAELPLTPGHRLLLPQSDLAGSRTATALRERGAIVEAVIAYRTRMGHGGADLPELIARGKIAAISFASPSALRYFRQRCSLDEALSLPALCLGPATAAAARELGFHDVIAPPKASLRAMLVALADSFAARKK